MKSVITFCSALVIGIATMGAPQDAVAQHPITPKTEYSHADTLRGSITPQRAWWDAVYYDLHVAIDPQDSTITGHNNITYRIEGDQKDMQIDMQRPMQIDSVVQNGEQLVYKRDGNAFFISIPGKFEQKSLHELSVYYHGRPKIAEDPPWEGGLVWAQDSLGNSWVSTAVQGLGASSWWPNKDHPSDEPDSLSISVTVPKPMVNVSNGRLRKETDNADGTKTYSWHVTNPINKYGVSINAGNYVNFTDTYKGEKGPLDLGYWSLKQHREKAGKQFKQVKPMLKCFEHWFGPYPFYEDSYKLVEAPYLGMEHQSAVTYGNGFQNGYHGEDLSGTGWGMKWDFIIIHESAHEWWANNVSAKDVADMWIHESFTNYAEALYTECQFGKKAGMAYTRGTRSRVKNNRPIIAPYGVNAEGTQDMYYKGGNMLLTIREIINDDAVFRKILRGIQKKFYHQTVTTQQIEDYFIAQSGKNLDDLFDQYLREANLPILQYYIRNQRLHYRWKADVSHFNMPVEVKYNNAKWTFITPTSDRWQTVKLKAGVPANFEVNKNFFIETDSLSSAPSVKE